MKNKLNSSMGESRIEMLSRSRYVLFKRQENWTASQQKRASLLFETFQQIKSTYELTQQITGNRWTKKM